ncbi:conserved Plasmodium protein, unknown function [Plasmodium berghei]|uniref:Uncharacterized protein n=2 Tax=Plasmodium berghei TaxID=5821 RepID=A0A509AER6_PLABA|nr:conserved Plasmodium protein, unknown function [Plasmodium berghei ANKA]CXI09001.1 conserved Plasmodium protein, unknown function [Plasmodium berghei]SCL92805.1 conserved Plasmodium protein, unknown function [Plasmodium berghei]SCM15722.1 conserved Plasmodium protein, unknown function [Plasmodium berghei]SCM17517.1 conserved Plasmodium protein, unknown function [Plasmodium berghei]SCN22920.1 conserved Plasmodium protein, unknown function [Plasmodium berghei]|eukprot:XP_034420328.1 conserved Plasmodium protein, unknown function [Plasmodium berghei ANKA]
MKNYRIYLLNVFKKSFPLRMIREKHTNSSEGTGKSEMEEKLMQARKSKENTFINKNKQKIFNNENNNIKKFLTKYNIYITYYSGFIFMFSVFSYCVVNLVWMFFEQPPPLIIVKENVLKDKKLIDEYEEIIFSKYWAGYINEDSARIIINIKSKNKRDKKGKIISNLIKKNNEWIIKTLTYYNVKKNDNLQTDDLKTLKQSMTNSSLCPINNDSFGCKKSNK